MRRFLVIRIQVRRTKAAMARIRERIRANKCVTCECATEDAHDANSAKLQCEGCRARLKRMLSELTAAKQQEFLKRLVREGFLILPHELRRLKATQEGSLRKMFEEVAERN